MGNRCNRRFAVDARQEQHGQQARCSLIDLFDLLPRYAGKVGMTECRKGTRIEVLPLRAPDAFEQEMVETEGKIECRIAIARSLGIEKQRAARPAENILWTDIALH